MLPLPSRKLAPRALLTRILDEPNLVAAVQALPAPALGKLIDHVGLEDAGEIVALATTSQLKRIFDDDLWRSERPGQDETFDAHRFALWLEVMLEAGDAFAAEKLADLPEDLVTLALHKHVLVINIEELALAMADRMFDDDELTEKALESCLCEEIDEYRIISRNHEGWDAILTVLLALDRDHHDFLGRVLEHCCQMAADFIEDNGGLYQVLTSDEMLESDVGTDREERRAEEGFIAPSSAASFLALARTTNLADILATEERDPVTRAYFRSLRTPARSGAARDGAKTCVARDTAKAANLVEILRNAEVLPPSGPTLLLQGGADAQSAQDSGLFTQAMRELGAHAADLHGRRMQELAYLANVLAAGCSLEGRTLRPLEAASAAVATCNLGLEHLLRDKPGQDAPTSLLQRTSTDKLFRIGWRLLGQDVVLAAARAFENALVREARTESNRERARALDQGIRTLRTAIATGKPWAALGKLAALEGEVDPATLTTLGALLDECPSLRGRLSPLAGDAATKQEGRFIATCAQLRAVQTFLAEL
jgi:hypothetical protein